MPLKGDYFAILGLSPEKHTAELQELTTHLESPQAAQFATDQLKQLPH